METAFPAESLVKRPFPVYTGGIHPVSVERSHYHVISGREFICNRLVGNQAGCTASDVARGYRERYGFGSGSGVLAGEIQAVLLQFPVIQKEQLDRTSREASGIYLRLVLRGAFGRIMDQGTEPGRHDQVFVRIRLHSGDHRVGDAVAHYRLQAAERCPPVSHRPVFLKRDGHPDHKRNISFVFPTDIDPASPTLSECNLVLPVLGE